ncbi:MAG: GTPase Era [Lachnospiraceae bacterium]|nr:GTPase Era [Lachnospiraceae bacterium]
MFKSGYAVMIGRPNVGKSTLMNHLIGQKIAITSRKPQTTRNRIETILTTDEGQIVFLDTPGMIRKTENKLGEYLMDVSLKTMSDADVVLFLVEPSSCVGEGDKAIIKKLKNLKKPVILVINKIDKVKKVQLPAVFEAYGSLMKFADIVPVSAMQGSNVDSLKEAILKLLPEGPKYYDEEVVTDQTLRQISAEVIREKALRNLGMEIPHGIAVLIDSYKERSETLTAIEATIVCERDSHKKIIIGKEGAMLKRIGSDARKELEGLTGTQVYLKLWVKVRRNWRDHPGDLKNFGYESDKKNG